MQLDFFPEWTELHYETNSSYENVVLSSGLIADVMWCDLV